MKPCPNIHCNGSMGVSKNNPRGAWWVWCPKCGACGPRATDPHGACMLWDDLPRVVVLEPAIERRELSETQERVYGFVRASILSGDPPTYEGIKRHFGWASTQAVASSLNTIIGRGWLAREKHLARSLRLVRGRV